MVVYNAASKELTAKIVYYGPGFGGKTTNLQFLHRRLEPSSVGNLLTLAATADRTIFFDLLPVELGDLKGYRIRFQVATVPGQSPYNETRRVVLRGADGVVFVVDSRWSQLPKNLESLQNLRQNLKDEGIDVATIPFAVQFNKRDLPDVLAVDALQEGLGLAGHPFIEAVASDGKGVVETFKLISKLTFVDILRRLQKRGTVKPARPATSETENLSAWKSSMVLGTSPHAPEIPPAPIRPAPEPLAFPEPDLGTTRAIPTLSAPKPAAAAVSDAASPPVAVAPFSMEEDVPEATEAPSTEEERRDAIVFETFPPLAESSGVTEDTNPAFFDRRRASSAPEPVDFPAPDDRVSTAGFAVPSDFAEPPPPEASEISFPSGETPLSPSPAAEEPAATEPPAAPEVASPARPTPVASPFEERMIQLAVVSAWGDRISAAEERLASWDAIEERLAGAEQRIAEGASLSERLGAIEDRIRRTESARGWAKDVDLLRTDWANARLASEGQTAELRRAISDLRQSLAEGSGREMELVAQVSRESLTTAAALEKVGFRIQETEEKFSQLVVDQESRLARLERLVDEQSARSTADRESARQAVLELEERFRAFREEEAESRRRMAAELDEFRKLREETEERQGRVSAELEGALRTAREERERERSAGQDLRGLLAESLTEIVSRLRRDDSAS